MLNLSDTEKTKCNAWQQFFTWLLPFVPKTIVVYKIQLFVMMLFLSLRITTYRCSLELRYSLPTYHRNVRNDTNVKNVYCFEYEHYMCHSLVQLVILRGISKSDNSHYNKISSIFKAFTINYTYLNYLQKCARDLVVVY